MELFSKKTSDSSAGFNNFSVHHFDGHPYQLFEAVYNYKSYSFSLGLDYWSEDFSQADIPFYNQRHLDTGIPKGSNLSCNFLETHNSLPTSISGCVQASEDFHFFPVTFNSFYTLFRNTNFTTKIGYGIGYLGGFANIAIKTSYYSGREQGDHLVFKVGIGHNLVHKAIIQSEYKLSDHFSFAFRAGYRLTHIDQFTVVNTKGSSEIFEIVMGKTVENNQILYIENYPGLSVDGEEFNLLSINDFFKPSEFYNKVEGVLNGSFLNLRILIHFNID